MKPLEDPTRKASKDSKPTDGQNICMRKLAWLLHILRITPVVSLLKLTTFVTYANNSLQITNDFNQNQCFVVAAILL